MATSNKPELLLVGSYPRPYGGNSVHVQRLQRALCADYRVQVLDVYGKRQVADDSAVVRCGERPAGIFRALRALRRSRAPLIHFHVSGMDKFVWAAYPLLSCVPKTARAIVTIHSGSFVRSFESGPRWRRTMARVILDRFARIIAVNADQKRFIETLGIDGHRVTVVPAFLPPVATASKRALETYASLGTCERVLVTSGCGLPHYGFHVILQALQRRADFARMGLVICAYDTYDEAYMARLGRTPNVNFTIVRDLDPGEFAWLLGRSDGYIRATDRDGDAVAIREATFFGKSVIASDCVQRPAGTRTFQTGDAESLAVALSVWRSSDTFSAGASALNNAELQAVLQVYADALA